MPIQDLALWTAFERVYGPILPHERIDAGFAMLAYYLVSLLEGKRRRRKVREFLPPYMQEWFQRRSSSPDELQAVFQQLADANKR